MSLIAAIFLFMQPLYCISFFYSFQTISNSLMRILKIFQAFTAKDENVDCVVVVVFWPNFVHFIVVFGSFAYTVIIHQHQYFLDFLSKYKSIPKIHHQNIEESLMLC